jgi:hypothetical protein
MKASLGHGSNLPPSPFLIARELRYCFECIFGDCHCHLLELALDDDDIRDSKLMVKTIPFHLELSLQWRKERMEGAFS